MDIKCFVKNKILIMPFLVLRNKFSRKSTFSVNHPWVLILTLELGQMTSHLLSLGVREMTGVAGILGSSSRVVT